MLTLPTDELARSEGCYLDETEPKKIRAFVEKFCRLDGSPATLLDWHWENYLLPLYGWRRPDGKLRFKRFFTWLPKKQGKSSLLSFLCLYTALTRKRGKVVIIAGTKQQGNAIFDPICEMIQAHPELDKAFWIRGEDKQLIKCLKTGATIQVLSGDPKKSGGNYDLLALDEIAEWPKAYARKIWDRIQSAGAARPNSLLLTISTAQFDKTSVGYEIYRTTKEVLEGKSEDITTGGLVYEVPEFADWREPENWWPALPSVPAFVPRQHYHDRYAQCRDNPLETVSFRTLDLNQWCGSPECWLPPSVWNGCIFRQPESFLYGSEAIIGIDYARSFDLCAMVLLIQREGLTYCLPRFFIPRVQAQQREDRDSVPYTRWADTQQHPNANLFLTEGDTVDGQALVNRIKQEATSFIVKEVRYDPTGMELIRQEIERQGFPTVSVTQSARYMSPGFKHLETLCRQQQFRHPDNPILNWNLDNCVPDIDKHDRLYVNKASDRQRMDGIDAIAIGLTYWLEEKQTLPQPPKGMSWVISA